MDGPELMLGMLDTLGAGLIVGSLREGLKDNVGAKVGLSVCKVHGQEVSNKNISIQRFAPYQKFGVMKLCRRTGLRVGFCEGLKVGDILGCNVGLNRQNRNTLRNE